jgi:hypothetical protein
MREQGEYRILERLTRRYKKETGLVVSGVYYEFTHIPV